MEKVVNKQNEDLPNMTSNICTLNSFFQLDVHILKSVCGFVKFQHLANANDVCNKLFRQKHIFQTWPAFSTNFQHLAHFLILSQHSARFIIITQL